MTDREIIYQAMVDHYCLHGLYGTVEKICQKSDSPKLCFWRAYALAMQDRPMDAIRELSVLQGDPNIDLAVTACLIHAHKACSEPDKKALNSLKGDLRKLSRESGTEGLLFAARFFWHSEKVKQARMCVEKVINKDRKNVEALSLYGWICLTSGLERQVKRSQAFFASALKAEAKHLPALSGRAHYNSCSNHFTKALTDANALIVRYPDYLPGLVAKARILFAEENWEEGTRTAERILTRDKKSIEALSYILLNDLSQTGSAHTAAESVNTIRKALSSREPKNHKVLANLSKLVSRMSGGNKTLLRVSIRLINKAIHINPDNAEYISELAYQERLNGDPRSALETYGRALKADEGYMPALHGRIRCKVELGKLKEAAEELEFMGDVSEDGEATSVLEIAIIRAILARKYHNNERKAIQALDTAEMAHKASLKANTEAGTPAYFITYNPVFLLDLVSELMRFVTCERLQPCDPPSAVLKRAKKILEELTKRVPGLSQAKSLLAECHYICNEFVQAKKVLSTLEQLDGKSAGGKMMFAKIHLAREAYPEAEEALAQALALDFDIRQKPNYFTLKARILAKKSKLEEALSLLQSAMALPGVKGYHETSPDTVSLTLEERMSVYVGMVDILSKLGKETEAAEKMKEARKLFGNSTVGKDRLSLAEGDMYMKRGDIKRALSNFKTIRSSSDVYMSARVRMAEIYLKRRQKHLYAGCYKELATKNPTLNNQMLLGDAYVRIQEPEKAIQTYLEAQKAFPQNSKLSRVIGSAMVATHDYKRACQYYEKASAAAPNDLSMACDLATLYRKLKDYGGAERTIGNILKQVEGSNEKEIDRVSLVKLYVISSDVARDKGDIQSHITSLQRAREIQKSILTRGRGGMSAEAFRKEIKIATDICFSVADANSRQGNDAEARKYYDMALHYDDTHEPSLIAMARLLLNSGDTEACERQCSHLLEINPENRDALAMLADCVSRRGDVGYAARHFEQLLERCPTEYTALERLITLLRRAGNIDAAKRYIETAKNSGSMASYHPGMHYCHGLYLKAMCESSEALAAFNKARKDSKWGPKAIEEMIKIYLDPGNGGSFTDLLDSKTDMAQQINAVEKLLDELADIGGDRYLISVFQAYCNMATRNRTGIEESVENLQKMIASQDARARDFVPALVAISTGLIMLKKYGKAKNFLKRTTRPTEKQFRMFQDDILAGWLLMAEVHIQNGKSDMAVIFCKKCTEKDKSCKKAWERLGYIREKESAYTKAALNYETAWAVTQKSSPNIGFKLAYNYLKSGRNVDAIDVCNTILKKFPNCTRNYYEGYTCIIINYIYDYTY
ncbi:hypothetical protein AAMO2058_000589800, partial [Amorphochlora amoebiformis]